MNIQVFTYGTLQSPLIMKALTNREFQGRTAILLNYAVFRVKKTRYPGIIPLKGSLVEGILYGGLDRHVLHLLDDYEGEDYNRIRVKVNDNNDSAIEAFAYVIREDKKNLLSTEQWDYDKFLENDLNNFLTGILKV